MVNTTIFQGIGGICRIATLVLGVIVLGFTVYFNAAPSAKGNTKTLPTNCKRGTYDPKENMRLHEAHYTDEQIFLKYYNYAGGLWVVLLVIVVITLIVSLVWIVLCILDVIGNPGLVKMIDLIYHGIGGGLLIIGTICWFAAEIITDRGEGEGRKEWDKHCNRLQAALIIVAGILGLADGVVYLIVAFFAWKSK